MHCYVSINYVKGMPTLLQSLMLLFLSFQWAVLTVAHCEEVDQLGVDWIVLLT